VIFFNLGTIHLEESKNKIKIGKYELPEVKFAKVNGVAVGRSNIETYATELQTALSEYIEKYNSATQKQNRFAAYGYFLAFGTSVLSFLATLFGQKMVRRNRSIWTIGSN
jgi:hypothetical protein